MRENGQTINLKILVCCLLYLMLILALLPPLQKHCLRFIFIAESRKQAIEKKKIKSTLDRQLTCSIALLAPLGGARELPVQHLASCRGSEPQTLGKAVLCPYKAAIHPLPSSSPAPFLSLSQTWGIFRESASASLPFLIRSSACCQRF